MKKLIAAMALVPMIALGAETALANAAKCDEHDEIHMSVFYDPNWPWKNEAGNDDDGALIAVARVELASLPTTNSQRKRIRTLLATANVTYLDHSSEPPTPASMWGHLVRGQGTVNIKKLNIRNRGMMAFQFKPHSKDFTAATKQNGICWFHYDAYDPKGDAEEATHGCVEFTCWR